MRMDADAFRATDRLRLAFSAEAELDPGTRLVDLKLDGLTPAAALEHLRSQPMSLSVAIHEFAHFVSLENHLGYTLNILAMQAAQLAEALEEDARLNGRIQEGVLADYRFWRRTLRGVFELYRPLLEGLAVYAQLHLPTPDGPEPIQPVAVFQTWHTAMYALGHEDRSEAAVSASLGWFQCGFATASLPGRDSYTGCIRSPMRSNTSIHPNCSPYFLGHTYLRSLQLALGRGSTEFLKDEVFFEFVLRILRTSKLFDLDETISWDDPRRAHTVYGWVDIVRDAPVQRIAASLELEERADILHFIATGECRDSESVIDREMRWFQGAFPALWTHLQWFARSCNVDGADGATLVIGALISCKRLNLSSLGMARIVGVIDGAWAPDSAVCLRVDQATWWLQASNASIELLTGSPGLLPRLDPSCLLRDCTAESTSCMVQIDCWYQSDTSRLVRDPQDPRANDPFPVLIELSQPRPGGSDDQSMITELVADSRLGVRCRLRAIDPWRAEFAACRVGLAPPQTQTH